MNSRSLRAAVKQLVPAPVRRLARRPVTYACRLRIWNLVLSELKGATPDDQSILELARRRGRITALRDLDLWQDPQLESEATIIVPKIGIFRVRPHSDDLYHLLPSREASVVGAIKDRLKAGSTFVDAGANIGFFTVLAGKIVGAAGRVYAIEMMPPTASRLRLNIQANDLTNVTVLEHALSATSGEEVPATIPEHKFGRASIVHGAGSENHTTAFVVTRTMDELLSGVPGMIDLIKMDLEGAEVMALKGASETLKRTRAIIFEQLPGEVAASKLLKENGFQLRMLDLNNVIAERP